MSALHDAAGEAIEVGNLGHLVTINPDGNPQMSAVLIKDDEIVAAQLGEYQKVRKHPRGPEACSRQSRVGWTPGGFATPSD